MSFNDPLAPPLSYRDLRNTPGIVAERLADGRPVPLNIEGETRALVFPVRDGDDPAELARELARVRFGILLRRAQAESVALGLDKLTMDDIDDLIAEVRAERMRAELPPGAVLEGSYGEDPPRRPGSTPRHLRPKR